MNPTSEQTAAIQTIDRALLVEAGAGTGKTWVLVQRFLYLLEQNPGWPIDGIIAITFTEKAAREMRTRIRHALEQRAAQSPDDPVWQARRRELDRLQVGTIHGLCARILRENAIAAGLDPRFAVLDENQAALLKEEAIEQALSVLSDPDPALAQGAGPCEALGLLATLQVRDLREQMAGLLQKRGIVQRLFAEMPAADELPAAEEDLLARWQAGVAAMRQTLWCDALQKDPDLSAAFVELPAVVIKDPQDRLANSVILAQNGCALAQQGNLVDACKAWSGIDLHGGRTAAWGDKALLEALKNDLRQVRDMAKKWDNAGYLLEVGEADQQAARALRQWRDLWLGVSSAYQELKASRYALDFDDLELLTGELLQQQPRSERLQAFLDGIRHLMVDEFQDTNQAQQAIVYALAHPQNAGRLFVVGDAKQSIYRFRQAQVAVFNRTAQDIQRVTGCAPVPLSRSFRTHEQLVNALNDLFATVLQPLGEVHAAYEAQPGPLQHQRASLSHGAPVELVLLPEKTAADESISAEDGRIFEARLLAEKLLALQAGGYPVWDRELQAPRPFRFDDAAILFRSTTSMVLYEEQFKAAGLPYLTVSGRGYYDRPEVRDLIALLRCLYNPADDLQLAAVLRSPLFNLSDETLYFLRWRRPAADGQPSMRSETAIPYAQALRSSPSTTQAEALAFATSVLDELWQMTGRVQVWDLLRTALDRTGFEATQALSDRDRSSGGRQRSNVIKFLELARENGGASLSAFLRTLDDLRATEAREGEGLADAPDSGAVQLMSIHAAKGLEFPVVAVADLGRSQQRAGETERLLFDPAFGLACMNRDENGDWQKPASYVWSRWLNERMEAAEAKRLLYVACTRAADLLILSGKTGAADSWLEEIRFAWQILESEAEDQVIPRPGYNLRVQRPAYQEEQTLVRTSVEDAPIPLILEEMPPLALPLRPPAQAMSISVTQLRALLSEARGAATPGEEEPPLPIRAAVEPVQDPDGRVSAYLVGQVIHHVLAEWSCLEMPESELARRVELFARREGITIADQISSVMQRCGQILERLRHSELYAEICSAAQRYSDVPFSLTTPRGMVHGLIDLLYQDPQGRWRLIDWKSEWVAYDQIQAHAEQHSLQLAISAEAARAALGTKPEAAVCFLATGARVWRYSEESLAAAWQKAFG